MSTTHDEGHELVLASRLAGELAPDAPEVQRLLSACPICRELLAELGEVSARLGESAAEREADLAAAARLAPEPSEPRLEARLAELARSAPARPRRWTSWLAAAALLLAGAFLWRALLPAPAAKPPIPLGGADAADWEMVGPSGVSTCERFSWRYHRPASSFLLLIYDADVEGSRPREIQCKESDWTPDAATLAGLPRHIRWEVEALGPGGTREDWLSTSPPSSASRSP